MIRKVVQNNEYSTVEGEEISHSETNIINHIIFENPLTYLLVLCHCHSEGMTRGNRLRLKKKKEYNLLMGGDSILG